MTTKQYHLFVFLLVASVIATACASTPTPSATPIPTATVVPATVAPTAEPIVAPTQVTATWTPPIGMVVALPSILPLQHWPPTDEAAYSQTDRTNIQIVWQQQLDGRGGEEALAMPISQKCTALLVEPVGYFYVGWELYEDIAGWCHTQVSLVDYLYRVEHDYAFINANEDETINGVFLVEKWMMPALSPLSYLSCNTTEDRHGVNIEQIPLSDSPVYSRLTVDKMGERLLDWDNVYYEDFGRQANVLVFVLGAPLNDDVLIQGPSTTYDYTVVNPCPRRELNN